MIAFTCQTKKTFLDIFRSFSLLSGLRSMKYPFEPLCILHFSRPMLATCSMYFLYLFSPTFENWMAFFKGWHISCSIWHVWLFFPFFAPKSFLEVGRTEGTTFFMCTYFYRKSGSYHQWASSLFMTYLILFLPIPTKHFRYIRSRNLKLFFINVWSLVVKVLLRLFNDQWSCWSWLCF